MNKKHFKSFVLNALKIGFAGALIYWLVSSGRFDVKSLGQLLVPKFIAIALSIVFLSFVCLSERWRTLLHAQGFAMGFFDTLKLTFIGTFFNFAMPGGVGGDLIKGFYVVRSQSHRKFDSAMTILMDRVFGLYVMVVMAMGSVVFGFETIWNHPRLHILFWVIVLIFLSFTAGLAIGFSSRMKTLAEKILPKSKLSLRLFQIWQGLLNCRKNPLTLVKVLVLSLIGQLIFIGFFNLVGNQLGFTEVPLSIYFISCLVGTMITAIPISPAGIGVGQAAFAFLFSEMAGADAATLGAGLATAGQGFQFALGLLGAWFYIQIKHHHPKEA
jgi:hypothetical protein